MKHIHFKRVTAGALSLVLAAGIPAVVLTGVMGTKASATSLPYIESIVSSLKGSSSSFHILEIVPQAGTGSMGYYVAGQEPSSNWSETLGAIKAGAPDANGAYGSAAVQRTQTITSMMSSLSSANLMSSGTDTPLTKIGDYSEVLPWQRSSGTSYRALTLDHKETASLTGEFIKKTDIDAASSDPVSGFNYTQQATYQIVSDGHYIQNISQFIPADSSSGAGATYFYYSPTFAPLDETTAESIADKNTPVYTNTATTADPSADPATGVYEYYAKLKSGLESGKSYYYVTSTGAPDTSAAGHSYKAALDSIDPYTAVSSAGYFELTPTGYTYVGDGKGVYRFSSGSSAAAAAVTYDTVYYIGGYTNNNWFLTDVLDVASADVSKIHVQVDSLTPAEVNAAADSDETVSVLDKISNSYYSLIVLSNGYALPGTSITTPYGSSNDLSAAVQSALATVSSSTNKTPVIVDHALTTAAFSSLKIGSLAASLASSSSAETFVKGNVYVINSALATSAFGTYFADAQFTGTSSPFYDVYYEIYHENFLRKTENSSTTDLLTEKVSMANSVRYIINYYQQRTVTAKSAISVLDLEPSSTTNLTKSTVLSWLPSGKYTAADITITTMSTAEFIGKIDDICETYDMVYIGPHGSYTAPTYNDPNMTGLIYTNIGDTYKSGFNMSGLLDRDYSSSKTFTSGGQTYPYIDATSTSTANLFRFSGNDLTAVKVQKLKDFAATGYPIILGDNLITDSSHEAENDTLTVTVTGESATSTGITLRSTAALTNSSGAAVTGTPEYHYAWYKANGTQVGSDSTTLSLSGVAAGDQYYCTVTATYKEYTANVTSSSVTIQKAGVSYSVTQYDYNSAYGSYGSGSKTYFNVSIVFDNSSTLKAVVTNYSSGAEISASDSIDILYKWRVLKNNSYKDTGVTSQTFSLTENGAGIYYCRAYINDSNDYAYSYLWKVASQTGNVSATQGSGTSAFNIPAVTNAKSVNTGIVDSASQVYALLDSIKSRSNVMTETLTQTRQDSVYEYLNLSKPQIQFTAGGTPSEYDKSLSDKGSLTPQTVDGKQVYALTYTFQIINATDATPQTTTYQVALYLDQDGDGNYTDAENLSDIRVTTPGASGSALSVEPDELKAGTSSSNAPVYTVARQLPDGTAGILPWKLEVTKNGDGNQYIHTSQIDYAYISPAAGQATTLNILQIDTTKDDGGYNLEYSTSQTAGNTGGYVSDGGTHFNGIYGKLLDNVSSDFNVHIYTLYVDDLNTLYSSKAISGWKNYFLSRESTTVDSRTTDIYYYLYAVNSQFNPTAYSDKSSALAHLLDQFDMVIVGFGDCYSELNQGSAQAVVNYISSGKSILFSHDTTSFYNLPVSDYKTVTSSGYSTTGSYWGYYFNTLLRSQVGLDRYGIVSSTTFSGGSTIRSALKSSTSASTLTSDQASAIQADGYTVAYQPGQTTGQTVPETQGFTNYELLRYSTDTSQNGVNGMKSVSSDNRSTAKVSQVNKGQITTYPYNLNTSGFGGSGSSISVSTTHEQYYQLNMNADDIVVWYCLADDSGTTGDCYASAPNDVTNNYYIYSVGNVTYTGAGHTSSASSVNNAESEAELFVNTMIAAYRPERTAPSLKVVDSASGANTISSYYLTADYSGSGYSSSLVENSADCPVYFVVTDTNLEFNRQISVSLSYVDSSGATATYSSDLAVHRASTTGKVYSTDVNGSSSMISGMVYYFNLPQEVLTDFGNRLDQSSMSLSLQVSTKFIEKNGTTSEKDSTVVPLTLQKIGLLNLG